MVYLKKYLFVCILLFIVGIIGFSVFPNKHLNKSQIPGTKKIFVQKSCPVGFNLVPGDPLYKTNDFCVMKYDAKCTNNNLKCVTKEGVYRNNAPECLCQNNYQIVSTASGAPITYIAEKDGTSDNAISYCQKQGWHLITNDEWMTIARNVEKVADNWCDKDGTNCVNVPGAKGKILANGHNDNSSQALAAGEDYQPCFGTTTDGTNLCGGKSSQKRTLTLSNGEIIWDFAGNVWQWVRIEVLRKDQPQSRTNGVLDKGWIWSEFSLGGLKTVITDNGKGSILGYDSFRPSNPSWNSNNGVGRIYHYSGEDNNTTTYTFIRGGNWRHGYDSGAFTVHMSPVASKENIDDVGFRCATNLE